MLTPNTKWKPVYFVAFCYLVNSIRVSIAIITGENNELLRFNDDDYITVAGIKDFPWLKT